MGDQHSEPDYRGIEGIAIDLNARIATLEKQLATQSEVIAADNKLFVDQLRARVESEKLLPNLRRLGELFELCDSGVDACRQARAAAKGVDDAS